MLAVVGVVAEPPVKVSRDRVQLETASTGPATPKGRLCEPPSSRQNAATATSAFRLLNIAFPLGNIDRQCLQQYAFRTSEVHE